MSNNMNSGLLAGDGRPIERRTVALVEDDEALRDELVFQLEHKGFDVVAFPDAQGLYRHMATQKVTAVVLDIGLPGESGLSIARLLRAHDTHLGIVFLTARLQRDDRLQGLQAGADVYLTKPVDLEELTLILRRLLNRIDALPKSNAAVASPHETEHWKLFSDRAILVCPYGSTMRLTMLEAQLLSVLVVSKGLPVKMSALARGMGLAADEWSQHRMEVIVSRLRSKVERHTGLKAPIRTIRGEGYAWAADEPPAPL